MGERTAEALPPWPDPHDPRYSTAHDPELAALEYRGDVHLYRLRVARIEVLRMEGKGPGAFLDDFLAACRARNPQAAPSIPSTPSARPRAGRKRKKA